ncbi:septum formation family protein [Microbacterium sp. zg.Y1090]|uniref:septum formation family protein n=1 Tax=Microbacterium TaxID=33882 RepID=UPI00214C77CA|nr:MULTISPECIES: septum formation family protein [unclassified Microbacterium]MCR2814183.1 septum formation family protein [Microbacterium sp. zg.Y1084]MCR2819986.1 septum formation family protein [Microbacterium sp. zg.Y1090]MDL5488149.1 septum formation family protein [Microbacterium sp. zg-Y1211]WIM27529.1 septum formation family protein [Microbacterium sp. zg-Y1090]
MTTIKLVRPHLAAAALLVIGLTSLSACATTPDTSGAVRVDGDESSQPDESGEAVDVFSISLGDCLNTSALSDTTQVDSVPVVPCSEPHEDEVYYTFDSTDPEYPGEDALVSEAGETCIAEFADFVGIAYEESALDYWPMYPSEQSWEQGDREILCMVYDPSGEKVTGSLAGSAR